MVHLLPVHPVRLFPYEGAQLVPWEAEVKVPCAPVFLVFQIPRTDPPESPLVYDREFLGFLCHLQDP